MNEKNSSYWYKRWTLIPLIFVLVLIGVFAKRLVDIDNNKPASYIPTVLLNTLIPEINLDPLPNRGKGLNSEHLRKKLILLNFWGSWCGACLIEHELLMEIKRKNIIPIHGIAWRDKPNESINWLKKYGDPYSLVGQDPESKAAIAFGVTGAPETFMINENGIIIYKHTGPITEKVWLNDFLPLIREYK